MRIVISSMYADALFASVDADLQMQRIAGGNETEVYCTDDERYVVKVKSESMGDGSVEDALEEARFLRDAARAFTAALGPDHTISNYYFVAQDSRGQAKPVIVQPYVRDARPLCAVNFSKLNLTERRKVAAQLRHIVKRSLTFYRKTGCMPDLYGRVSRSQTERERLNRPYMLPWRIWSFLAKRTLLRSHNLLLTDAPERRIVLVDYDPVQKNKFYRFVYYKVRRLLFLRDLALVELMDRTGRILPWKRSS
jgi:hypothetical protein